MATAGSDLAVFRPATATWHIRQSSTATDVSYAFGKGTDIPVPGDYDGDQKTDPAVYRPSTGVWSRADVEQRLRDDA